MALLLNVYKGVRTMPPQDINEIYCAGFVKKQLDIYNICNKIIFQIIKDKTDWGKKGSSLSWVQLLSTSTKMSFIYEVN